MRTMDKATATNPGVGAFRRPTPVRFNAALQSPREQGSKPGAKSRSEAWTFLILPKRASAKLPSRGLVAVEGTINGASFQATLEPDGRGGHWLRVDRKLRLAAGASAGDVVSLELSPLAPGREPEPKVPPDLRAALAAADHAARVGWADITPAARRDFIHWITSPKRPETRVKRIATACDMLAKGKRRPCCFDRSGMFSGSLGCPAVDEAPPRRSSPRR